MKDDVFVELTVTDNCNCKCQYCFEGSHCNKQPNENIRKKQLELLTEACQNFNADKYSFLTVSFWGGEPFLDVDFMTAIVNATCNYDFVRYHCYSNGTLTENVKKFFTQIFAKDITNRFHIQLSYDGEPHHSMKRHDNKEQIFRTAEYLQSIGIKFSFKATLSYDMLQYLPQIWKSYEELYDKFGNVVSYYPTLDTTSANESSESFETWKTALIEVAKYERQFILKHHLTLFKWFDTTSKRNCRLNNSIHMHSDGNIYICHGCAYKHHNTNLKLGNVMDISSLYEVLSSKYKFDALPEKCQLCPATHCQVCHADNLGENDDPSEKWLECRVNNQKRCEYFKYFGYVSELLKFSLIKSLIWRM